MMNNRDRLAEARTVFAQMKNEFQSTGAKVTISSVAQRANIDRKYLYGKVNTPDKEIIRQWVQLGEEITSFRKFQKKPALETGEVPVATKLHNSLIENYSLLESVRDLEQIRKRQQMLVSASQKKIDELEDRMRRLEAESIRLQGAVPVIVNLQSKPLIISPDSERQGNDQLSLKKAWVQALNHLREALSRPVDKTLFITIGAPASGKSTWCRTFASSCGFTILFDACNLTQSDRYELLDLARQYDKTKVVAVVFCAELKKLESRNKTREEVKRVPVTKLRAMHRSVEHPSLVESDESFDEIIMLRG